MSSLRCELTVDLDSLVENWRYLQSLSSPAICAAVVKANAYGLGVAEVARALYAAGCTQFFVATVAEAETLRNCGIDVAEIFVLLGPCPGEEPRFPALNAIPVLPSMSALRRWIDAGCEQCPAAVKIDTGMSRLGLTAEEFDLMLNERLLGKMNVRWILSHLACADTPEHPQNQLQLKRFAAYRERILQQKADIKFSLANSAATMLSPEYHFDMVRPGIALYGAGVRELDRDNKLRDVVHLNLPIVQIKDVGAGEGVGYGATYVARSPRKLAVVAGGYADGIFRCLGNRGEGWVRGSRVPMVGRVSMDSTVFDVSEVAEALTLSDAIEVLGQHISVDAMAAAAGTIGYEVLTCLGQRYRREYRGMPQC